MKHSFSMTIQIVLWTDAAVSGAQAWDAPVAVTPSTVWKIQRSSNPSSMYHLLYAASAVSANDIFAVGTYRDPEGAYVPLAEHWDGSSWSATIPPEGPCGDFTETTPLTAVAAISSNDAWAVGYCTYPGQKLIVHWDGKAWTEVSAPEACKFTSSFLSGVTAFSPTDVWAVGGYRSLSGDCGAGFYRPLTLHWDGSNWKVIPPQLPTQASFFFTAVAGTSSSDLWAVGTTDAQAPVIEHWDGSEWKMVNSPGSKIEFTGIVALTPTNAWAVASNVACQGGCKTPLIEHWDGSIWSIVSAPKGKSSRNVAAIAAASPNDIWAVGSSGSNPPVSTLTLHWDGQRWSVVPSPPHGQAQLFGVTALPTGDVWAVGFRYGEPVLKTLVLTKTGK